MWVRGCGRRLFSRLALQRPMARRTVASKRAQKTVQRRQRKRELRQAVQTSDSTRPLDRLLVQCLRCVPEWEQWGEEARKSKEQSGQILCGFQCVCVQLHCECFPVLAVAKLCSMCSHAHCVFACVCARVRVCACLCACVRACFCVCVIVSVFECLCEWVDGFVSCSFAFFLQPAPTSRNPSGLIV